MKHPTRTNSRSTSHRDRAIHGRTRHHRQGAYIVEMAVAVPVLFAVVFGGFELMFLSGARHAANQAAYEAARRIVIPGGSRDEAIAAANLIVNANGMSISSLTITPDTITRQTREVRVDIGVKFEKSWSVAGLVGERTIEATCTLGHENASLFLE